MKIQFADAAKYQKEVKQLYKSAFPILEQVPLFLLYRKAKQHKIDFLAVLDDEKFVGLASAAMQGDVVIMLYLAISDAVRGKGYGSAVLQAVQKKYAGKRIILNIEEMDEQAANYAQRVKRKAFYQKNGFEILDYKVREVSTTYDMMSCGGYVSKTEYEEVMALYTGKVLYFIMKKI